MDYPIFQMSPHQQAGFFLAVVLVASILVFGTMWLWGPSSPRCPFCNSVGTVIHKNVRVNCPMCRGNGSVTRRARRMYRTHPQMHDRLVEQAGRSKPVKNQAGVRDEVPCICGRPGAHTNQCLTRRAEFRRALQ